MTVIGTNTASLRAGNASTAANMQLSNAMQRLSTGKRINSAKDDAAGLAIATSMTSQIRGMTQAVRNANDGMSMAQTADGGLAEIVNMLQRIRELAVQSASGTYSDDDRTNLQVEVTALTTQISSIISNTKFNGVVLFGDDADTITIQVGSSADDTVDIEFETLDLDDAVDIDISDREDASDALETLDDAMKTVNELRAKFGAAASQLQSVVNNLNTNIENLSDARSQIEDTDFSAETAALAKAQILTQASTAMLAQANQSQQGVLKLLQ